MKLENIAAAFDSYSRIARFYPALLTITPLAVFGLVVYPGWVEGALAQNTTMIAVICAIFYLFASFARSLGKRAELNLTQEWGAWPTTIMLRHSDHTIDRYTKDRYHRRLEDLANLTMPSAHEEAAAPSDADDRYRSATRRLIESRRTSEYKILHHENASYGCRRNMLGLRPVAVGLCLALILVTSSLWYLEVKGYPVRVPGAASIIAFDVLWAVLWTTIVTRSFVLQAAQEYSQALLKTLDYGD